MYTTRLTYDLPSSLMSGLRNEKVAAAAKKLDAKVIALAIHATGAEAKQSELLFHSC
jgi:hypothetical protein